ncbi:MAG TPA: methylenetetrahydrofolate--tRNA-(uracil(54)-C(5))-methyltransferase (FADH(2)-oxidizing) TrmFO [Clostridia bacterium]|nr:methylenetetrahydrofolate--tRNA-(uracil(54)-C(5))-methyltransferase (FADH(2)-oxidizing) TrmFO [Clostridia bacterium]
MGAGLAGCEAAYQLAERGVRVLLSEMRPRKRSPAHKTDDFAELVCSNSLRSDRLENGAGLLKEELRRIGSLIVSCADETRLPAGGALAVDREGFAKLVTMRIRQHPNIKVVEEEVTELPEPPCIIATGPLTEGKLLDSIESFFGESLHFYDAAAPVVTRESLDMEKIFEGSRYGRGSDYLNCPMDEAQYFAFVRELVAAQRAPLHSFEPPKVFEGCMPVEIMAARGEQTLAFGPLKPVGLEDPRTGKRPYAVVQLRRDDAEGTLYNIVGFQTNLLFGEQKRVFGMIPGLERAEFVRYGVMHRNTFLNSPGKLDSCFQSVARKGLYFAGQLTGVEGYIESAASGALAGIDLARQLLEKPRVDFTGKTAIGALGRYVSQYAGHDFQPMNINYGIVEGLEVRVRGKQDRYGRIAARALETIDGICAIMSRDCE